MQKRMLPYLFLTLLATILAFTLGVRHGTQVEQGNKVISYFLTVTPPRPQPTATPATTQYGMAEYEDCRISLLLPLTPESSPSATTDVTVTCENVTPVPTANQPQKSITVNGRTVPIAQSASDSRLQLRHPQTGRLIDITVPTSYLPLVEQTLTFE